MRLTARCPGGALPWPADSTTMLITAAELEASWPRTGVPAAATVQAYRDRAVLRVHAGQGAFAAKVAADPRPPGHDDLRVRDYLAGRRFPHAPRLVHTRDGQRVARSADRVACVMGWVPRPAGQGHTPAGTWARLGEAAGRLNAHTDFPAPFAIAVPGALAELAAWVKGAAVREEIPRPAGATAVSRPAGPPGAHPRGNQPGQRAPGRRRRDHPRRRGGGRLSPPRPGIRPSRHPRVHLRRGPHLRRALCRRLLPGLPQHRRNHRRRTRLRPRPLPRPAPHVGGTLGQRWDNILFALQNEASIRAVIR